MKRFGALMCGALVLFNGVMLQGLPLSIDDLRGSADCKDCVEDSKTFAECMHWNPGLFDPAGNPLPVGCKATACLENTLYYTSCTPTDPSQANCDTETREGVYATQQIKTGGPFDCGVDPGDDPANWPPISDSPDFPDAGDCHDTGLDDAPGKCFIAGCGGTEVDEIDGAANDKERIGDREVCVW
jgi:hypothetical protein